MHNNLKEPHLFNAGPNPFKLIRNLSALLTQAEIAKLNWEIDANVILLFQLGEEHFNFACATSTSAWRQRTSRFYYGAYNVRRALALKHDGSFSTDSSDHKNVDALPTALQNIATHKSQLKKLRDDRNLADYSHLAVVTDLLLPLANCEGYVRSFIKDARDYLAAAGIIL